MMTKRGRLSIDLFSDEHRQIKIYATLHGETIRDYVLESVRDRLKREAEEKASSDLISSLEQDPVLTELWNNKKDAAYDKL